MGSGMCIGTLTPI